MTYTIQIIAEYIWLDSSNQYRSKTKIFTQGEIEENKVLNISSYPNWNYDGSSCGDNKGILEITECILVPHAIYNDPFNQNNDKYKYVIILCRNYYYEHKTSDNDNIYLLSNNEYTEYLINDNNYILIPIHPDMEPKIWDNEFFKNQEFKLGFEQEFFMINPDTMLPFGFKKNITYCPFTFIITQISRHLSLTTGFLPIYGKQGPYYCSVGNKYAYQRNYLKHTQTLLQLANINITGFNYEVAPGQAEFQVFGNAINACNDLLMLRYILQRNSENYNINISFEPIVIDKKYGHYNMSGCHTNISFNSYRNLLFKNNTNLDIQDINNIDVMDLSNFDKPIEINTVNDFFNIVKCLFICNFTNNSIEFNNIFGDNNNERCNGELETSNWHNFTWGIGTRDTSIRINVDSMLSNINDKSNKNNMYYEDRRPSSNVEPYTILKYWYNTVLLIFNKEGRLDILHDALNINDCYDKDKNEVKNASIFSIFSKKIN